MVILTTLEGRYGFYRADMDFTGQIWISTGQDMDLQRLNVKLRKSRNFSRMSRAFLPEKQVCLMKFFITLGWVVGF